MEHCVLPELPGKNEKERHILSHDTVEASLMKQAGYQVWFAYLEPGSYEEGPPNLSESLKRDRRWCQGNLQHFWFLFAPQTRFENRIHIFFGLMAYLTAPMLVLFIGLSAFDYYWKEKAAFFSSMSLESAQPVSTTALWLLAITVALLFVPKILGTLLLLPKAKAFGKRSKSSFRC
jgi:membrane glycosyltransferase